MRKRAPFRSETKLSFEVITKLLEVRSLASRRMPDAQLVLSEPVLMVDDNVPIRQETL